MLHPIDPESVRNEELCQAMYAAREEFARSLGEVDSHFLAPLINPSFMGGPQWPDLRQAWRVIRRGPATMIMSDGLSDPFPEVAEANHGFALEILVESSDAFPEALQGTWLFDLVYQVSQQAAHHGGFRELIDRLGVVSMELPLSEVLQPFATNDGRVGVLLGTMPVDQPDGFESPGGDVRIVTAKLLWPAELEYVAAGGKAAREELLQSSLPMARCILPRSSGDLWFSLFSGERPAMQRIVCLFLLISFALLSGLALAQEQQLSPALAAAVDSAVQAEMNKQQAVGVAVGVLQQGKIVYLKGYGLADREKESPVTVDTVFNWASNSKPLAAVAAMQLVEKKQLDLDADVRQYVPEFPDKGADITTRHLLIHQSGIPHYSNGRVLGTERKYEVELPFLDPVLALDKFNRSPLIFQPGEKNEYSSYAYVLLSAVVQRAGKQDFVEQVQSRIARPLQLKSLQLDFATKDQAHWAAGYQRNLTQQIVRTADEANYWKHGAGGYKSNIVDFAKWAAALLNHRLVTAEIEQQMWMPHKLASGQATTRGLGFIVEDQNGLKVSHNGGQPETATRMVLYPKAGHGVVVMCNCQFVKPGDISTAIYAALNASPK